MSKDSKNDKLHPPSLELKMAVSVLQFSITEVFDHCVTESIQLSSASVGLYEICETLELEKNFN